MATTRLHGLIVVAAILSGLAATSLFLHATSHGGLLAASDEFGRNLYESTCDSLLHSYVEAGANALIALAVPVLIAGASADRNGAKLRLFAHGCARILDAVPLVLWLAIVFSGLGVQGFAGRQIALTLVALPFTLGMVLDRFGEITTLPFARNARACGVGLPDRLVRLVIPNALSSFYFPVVVMFGLSLTFDAVLGLMGMANRSTLSLGTLLWRAKERALVDDRLCLLAILALLLTIALFTALRQLLMARNIALISPDLAIAGGMANAPLLEHVASDEVGTARWMLQLFPGESIGVAGPSGAGKTTVIRMIAHANVCSPSPKRIAYLPQNPRDLFPSHLTVISLASAFAVEQADAARFWTNVRTLLAELGLDPAGTLQAPSASLSGGEVQRAAIAILLATEPELLLADEPSSSLDQHASAAVVKLFAAQRASRGLTLLVASHNPAFLAAACNQVFELTDGALVRRSSVQIPKAAVSKQAPAEAAPLLDVAIISHVLASSGRRAPRTLLREFRQSIQRGVVYGLTGESGVGKSTLLRILAGYERPTRGRVTRFTRDRHRPFAVLTPQDARQFFDPRRTMDAHARLLAAGLKRPPEFSELAGTIGRLELGDVKILARRADTVSGGEAQRLALAVTLWLAPRLMCFDEIDTGVPIVLKEKIGKMIRRQVSSGGSTAVLVSHDLAFLGSNCDQVIHLEP